MSAPTIEMGLGGSLRASAESHGYVKHLAMRAFDPRGTIIPGISPYRIAVAGTAPTLPASGPLPIGWWLNGQDNLFIRNGAILNVASGLPEGGTAVGLDGVDDYLTQSWAFVAGPDEDPISIEAVLTIDATPGAGDEPTIWGASAFGLTYADDGRVYGYYNGAAVVDVAVSVGAQVHVVLTRAGTSPDSVVLYVNGIAVDTATPALASLAVGSTFFIGKHWTNAEFLEATVRFVATYSVALSAGQVAANYAALSWTDVTDDTRGESSLVIERGIRDDKPSTRVASTGTCSFAMNNLGSNSGGANGYYSPGHASCRAGFGKGTPVRVSIGGEVQFFGRVKTIAPTPGKGDGLTHIVAVDYMNQAATFLLENVAIMEAVRGDEVFSAVLGLITNQPNGIVANAGSETYTLALDNTRDESVSALKEFHRLAISELGYVYLRRTGSLVYEARSTRIAEQQTPLVTLADTMIGIDVAEVSDDALNRVQVTTHPRVTDVAATTVLFALANPLQIAAGETRTILGPYRTDSAPGLTTRVGGLDMVTPVATTDYTMNAESDGSGANLTAFLTVTTNFGANGVQLLLQNTSTQPAYVTLLQCRGRGVYDYRTVVVRRQNDQAVAADGVNALNLDMVYQEDATIGQSLADSLLTGYGDLSGTRVQRVHVYPDAPGMPASLFARDISDRVAVSETQTGATGEYYINGVRIECKNGTLPKLTWWLAPAEPVSFWVLDVSELGTSTQLAA